MKQFLDLLRDVKENGHDHSDRTGTGRRSIFGRQIRFNLQEGFPLVTTRKIYTKALIEEMLWFIKGSTDTSELKNKDVNIWNNWAVNEKDIESFIDNTFSSNVDDPIRNEAINIVKSESLNSIGPMYGYNWRNAPQAIVHSLWPTIEINNIPKDKMKLFLDEYEINKDKFIDEEGNVASFEEFATFKYYSTVDQLNDLIINLKNNPYSARHVVTAWIPAYIPFENKTPQENVLLKRGALAPCHMSFQCFVQPSKTPEGKKLLSLKMNQR